MSLLGTWTSRRSAARAVWHQMRTKSRLSCFLVITLASVAVSAQPSFAGTYPMRSCAVPGQPVAPLAPWGATTTANVSILDGCATGSGIRFVLPGARSMIDPSRASLDLALPSDQSQSSTTIEGVRAWVITRFAGLYPVVRGVVGLVQGPAVATAAEFGDGLNDSDPVTQASLPNPSSGVQIALVCKGSDRPTRVDVVSTCDFDHDTPLEVRGLEVTLREDVAPKASAFGGTLLTDGSVSGTRTLDYLASDVGSGVARTQAVLDGGTVAAVRDLTDRCHFTGFVACPPTDRDSLAIDTREVADGPHSLALRVTDAAGNRHDELIKTIDVRNSKAPSGGGPFGLTPEAPRKLTASFAGTARASLIVPFGRRVVVRGRLTGLTQPGVASGPIEVFERVATAGARETKVGGVGPRDDGRFAYTLAARRPSRSVRFVYRSARARLLRVRVRAASTLKVSLRGTLVRFSGRVLSRPIPAAGKRVIIEGSSTGHRWAPLPDISVRTDRRGRFSGRYRLRAYRPGVRLRFRVKVPTARSYPYLNYTGRSVTVRVG